MSIRDGLITVDKMKVPSSAIIVLGIFSSAVAQFGDGGFRRVVYFCSISLAVRR